MPEKISILKESGETLSSNIVSVFMIPDTEKKYMITTENAVDPHGLTVLHVSEIVDGNLQKVATDEEWSSIKTIMRAIISGSVGSYQYLPPLESVKAASQYSRDISVSAAASKQMIDNYTVADKNTTNGNAAQVTPPPAAEPEATTEPATAPNPAIFPATNENTASAEDELIPGIAEVDENATPAQPAATPEVTPVVVPNQDVGASLNNNVIAPTQPIAVNDPLGQPNQVQPNPPVGAVDMMNGQPSVPANPVVGNVGVDPNLVANPGGVNNPVMGSEIVNGPVMVSDNPVVAQPPIPVMPDTGGMVANPAVPNPMGTNPLGDMTNAMGMVPQNVGMMNNDVQVPNMLGIQGITPEIQNPIDVSNIQVNSDFVAPPPIMVNNEAMGMTQPEIQIVKPTVTVPTSQIAQEGQANVVVPETKIDMNATPSFAPNATLDEVVVGAQEMFMEGVKNLIQTIQEKVYRELYAKEAELKAREASVEQREKLVNEQMMVMMSNFAAMQGKTITPLPATTQPTVIDASNDQK